MKYILLLLFVLNFISPSFAATLREPAYGVAAAGENYPWKEGLFINFELDENLCKKKYGNRWRIKCALPNMPYAKLAKGVKMSPPVPGHWEWRGERIVFLPRDEDSLKPATLYKIDFANLHLPDSIHLNATHAQIRTSPLAVRLTKKEFLIDPSPHGRHRLSASFEFNYPVKDSAFIPELSLPQGYSALQPEAWWNPDRDGLNISWQVSKLGREPAQARITFSRMAQTSFSDGSPAYYISPNNEAVFFQDLPAANSIFKINGVELAQETDADMNRIFVLKIVTSLYASQPEILKNISIVELPVYNAPDAIVPYDWASAPHISKADLQKGRVLKPVPLNEQSAPGCQFKFKIPAQAGRYVMVAVDSGLAAANSQKLEQPWFEAVKAAPLPEMADFRYPGHVLPSGGNLDVYGYDLDSIDWEIQAVDKRFLALAAQASKSPFEQPLQDLESAGLGMDNLGASIKGNLILPRTEKGAPQFAALNPSRLLDSHNQGISALALVTLKGKIGDKEISSARRLLLITDLSLMVKTSADGSLNCFARFMKGNKAASGAHVLVLGANGQPVAEGRADGKGYMAFPSLAGLSRESRPVAVVAEADGNLAWVPIMDKTRALNFSDFDAAGKHVGAGNILCHIFSQRGLYRPGDTVYFGCMPRRGDFGLLPPDAPLYAEILDPRGLRIWEKYFSAGSDGLVELAWRSSQSAQSGTYVINARAGKNGDVIGSCSTRIEEFEPETLKLKITAPDYKGWLVGGIPQTTAVELRNLYGSPAGNNRIALKYAASKAHFSFPKFGGYAFFDPRPLPGDSLEKKLGEKNSDNEGRAVFEMPQLAQISARITLMAEGFEKSGGRAATGAASFLVSPAAKLVGWAPAGALTNMEFIPQNSQASIKFIAINNELDPVSWENATFSLSRQEHVAALLSDGNGGYKYDETPRTAVLKTWQANIPPEGLEAHLDTASPGEFILEVMDGGGQVIARIPYRIAGEQKQPGNGAPAMSKMRLALDNKEYKAGDEIKIALSLPYDASGIISIERDNLEAFEWVDAHAGDNMASIKIPENFDGKGHVVAAFQRALDSKIIQMSPLAWAAAPFSANLAVKDMGLSLNAPKHAIPGETLKIRASAQAPGKAVVFAVDEGILQLTAYRTPNPLQELLGDRALDVNTLQIADLLLPYSPAAPARKSLFGGGAEMAHFAARFQNPFKRRNEPPVVFWSGIIDIGVSPTEIEIPLPQWYGGQLRIMAIGSSENFAGAAETQLNVSGGLMLTPAFPVAAAPGDTFQASLLLANTTGGNMDVVPQVETDGGLEILRQPPAKISIQPGQEVLLPLPMKAGDQPGDAKASIICEWEGGSRARDVHLSIRPPSPLRTTLRSGRVEKSGKLAAVRDIYQQKGRGTLLLGSMPVGFALNLGKYLSVYPYGCTEQLISKAFSLISLENWPGFNDGQKRKELLDAVLQAINSRFNGQGVALWPNGAPNRLLTIYAADFLLTMMEKGVGGNEALIARLCDAIAMNLSLDDAVLSSARECAYGIWILAREGRIVTQQIEELLGALQEKDITGWELDLAGAFIAGAKKEMRLQPVCDLAEIRINPDGWFDEYAQQSLLMTLGVRYFPDYAAKAEKSFVDASILAVNNGAFSTFSAAQGIKALTNMAYSGTQNMLQASVRCEDKENNGNYDVLANGALLRWDGPFCQNLEIDLPAGSDPVFWQMSITGYDRQPPARAGGNMLEISREYLDANGDPAVSFRQGDEVTVRFRLRGDMPQIKDLVISDLLPGGLEMLFGAEGKDLPENLKWLDRREDRMLVFADLENGYFEMAWKARAVTPGVFSIPPIAVECMYDASIYAVGNGGKLEIAANEN